MDGEYIGATPYEGALEELLNQLKSGSANENTISCEFAEDVEIKQEYVPTDKVMNLATWRSCCTARRPLRPRTREGG